MLFAKPIKISVSPAPPVTFKHSEDGVSTSNSCQIAVVLELEASQGPSQKVDVVLSIINTKLFRFQDKQLTHSKQFPSVVCDPQGQGTIVFDNLIFEMDGKVSDLMGFNYLRLQVTASYPIEGRQHVPTKSMSIRIDITE
ncbi:MAG: hypothetical protein AAFV78_11280 [Bacteroidota bacterium]